MNSFISITILLVGLLGTSTASPAPTEAISITSRQRWPCPDRAKPYLTPGCSSIQYVSGGSSSTFVASNGIDLYVNRNDGPSKTPIRIRVDCGNSSIHPPPIIDDPNTCFPILTIKPQPRLCVVYVEPAGVRTKMFGCVPPKV